MLRSASRPRSRGSSRGDMSGSMSRSLAVTASGLDSAVHAALGSAAGGSRVSPDRLPSVAQRRMPPGVMRALSSSLSGGSPSREPTSRPTSRASSRHSFEGLGQHSVWEPSAGGAPSWERRQVAVFDRRSSRPQRGRSAERRESAEKLGGKAAHPFGSLTNPVPADVQAEVRRLEPLVKAAEQRREQATLRLAELQDQALSTHASLLAEVEAQEEADVRAVFDGIDLDGNGTLERNELDTLAQRLLHRPLSKAELDKAMADMDEDGSGEVDFEEFLVWWRAERGNASSPWAGLFGDVLDGSNRMVKLKIDTELQKEELEAAEKAARPLVDELQRLLAVAGWHFRAQADGELRGGSPGWRQTYHAGPADDSVNAKSEHGRDEFLMAAAAAAAEHSRSGGSHARLSGSSGSRGGYQRKKRHGGKSGQELKGNLRPVSAASASSMGSIRLAPHVQDTAGIGHRLGMQRRPRVAGADAAAGGPSALSLEEMPAWQSGEVKDRVWTVHYPDDHLVREELPTGRDLSNRVWSMRDVWN
jgi:hypothetical protein